jgi:hypothetical protein
VQIRHIAFTLIALGFSSSVWSQSQHGGHTGGSSSSSRDSGCIKAKVSNFQPANMETIAPGGEFSAFVSGSNGPGHIHVTIRNQPITVNILNKDTFYVVKGKLPAELRNETVRISISAKAKNSQCDSDTGWLLKVSE